MDTNTSAALIEFLRAQQSPNGGISMQMLVILIASLPATIAALGAFYTGLMSRKVTAETKQSVDQVHVAVNSERTKMQEELQRMNAIILRISEENASMSGATKERAGTVSPAPSVAIAVAPSSPAVTSDDHSKLVQAIVAAIKQHDVHKTEVLPATKT
jgi:hypothetical protein